MNLHLPRIPHIVAAILLVAGMWLAAACTSGDVSARLDLAETLIDQRPDSALAILDAIDPSDLAQRRHRALYALLMTRALDKNYIDVTSDSLISIATEYYADSDDKHRRMLAEYYHGRVKYNAAEYPQSLLHQLKAIRIARESDDPFWTGFIAQSISEVYNKTFNKAQEVDYAREAYINMQAARRQPYLTYSMLSLAGAYLDRGDRDSCIILGRQLLDSAAVTRDTNLEYYARNMLGIAYYDIDSFAQSQAMLAAALAIDHPGSDVEPLSYLGAAMAARGNLDSAEMILDRLAADTSNLRHWLEYKIADRQHDTPRVLGALRHLHEQNVAYVMHTAHMDMDSALADYFDYEHRIDQSQLRTSRLIWLSLIIILVAILGVATWIFIRAYRRNMAQIETNVAIAQNAREILSLRETEIDEARSSIEELLSTKFDILEGLCRTVYEKHPTAAEKKKISDEVKNLIGRLSTDTSHIAELESFVDRHRHNLLHDFRSDYPMLKDADYRLMLYSALGFSSTAIALFLHEEKVESVYNRKARLKSRIKASPTPRSTDYLGVLQ